MRFWLAAAVAAITLAPAGQARKPNIVFIMADDLGYGDLSCYGQKKFATPRLDRMAAEGTRFTQYYAGSTVCAPSRSVLMTGLHTGHTRIRGNARHPLLPEDVTVAEVLKAAGYATGIMGKWGLGEDGSTGVPNRQGFDEWFGYLNQAHAHRHFTDHLFRNEENVKVDPAKEYTHDLFTEEALKFVRKNREKPFFLYLPYTVPHAELWVPEDSLKEFRGKFPEKPFTNATADKHPSAGYRSQKEPNAALAAMVTRLDRDVGRLLDLLKELGLDGDTLVLFTSDNGPHKEGGRDPAFFDSSGPLRGIKRDLTDGGIRVPMIARWPGKVPAGRTSEQVWSHCDFLATAADAAGAKAPEGDGLSMLPALLGKEQLSHEFLYWEFHEKGFQQAVRMGDWKGIRSAVGAPLEVFNLKDDVGERDNVAAKNPEIVSKIEAHLKAARSESEHWPIKSGGKK